MGSTKSSGFDGSEILGGVQLGMVVVDPTIYGDGGLTKNIPEGLDF